jgi:DNA-binding transcriptional LysR family regulator
VSTTMSRASRIEMRHLRRIVEIAEAGDLAAAARTLGMPERRLQLFVRELEASLGSPVFETTPCGLVPTRRGAEIIEVARSVSVDMGRLLTEATADERPVVRLVGVEALLSPVVVGLARERPDIMVTSRFCGWRDAVRDVAAAAADVAAAVRWPHVTTSRPAGVESRDIRRHPLRVLLPSSHPLAGRAFVELADLAGEAWGVRADGDEAESVPAECRRFGVEPDIRFRLGTDGELHGLVASGAAVTLTAQPFRPPSGITGVPYRDAAPAQASVAWRAGADPGLVDGVVSWLSEWYSGRTWAPGSADARDRPETAEPPLRMGVAPELAAGAQLPRMRTVHGVDVQVQAVDLLDLACELDAGRVDFALWYRYPFLAEDWVPASWPRVVVARDEPVLVAVSAGTSVRPVRLEELAGTDWAASASPAERAQREQHRALGGFQPRVAAVYDSLRDVEEDVGSGRLARLAEPGGASGCISLVPVDHPAARRSLTLGWRPGRPLAARAGLLAAELRRSRLRPPPWWSVPAPPEKAG